jgi:FkbM family methyltransferase
LELNPRTGENYLRGEAEPAVQQTLLERLCPGMVFYDLGANIGLFSLFAARIVGEGGRVFSFEPDAENAARLRRNVARNNVSNVIVVEAGAWSSSGAVNFVTADASSPDRGTGQFIDCENRAGRATQCFSLDDFVVGAPPPDAIKCDIEGAEVEALRGAEKLLRARHPWIVCETHSESNDRIARELLREFGYAVETLDGNHILALAQSTAWNPNL